MPVIRDPDFIDYGEYDVSSPPLDPYTASKNNAGQPAQLLIDYDDRKFALTAPKYGEIGAGNTNLVGYGGTGGVTGQALYSKFKQIWKDDNTAVKFPFPMEAITPESFEFINGWEPDDDTELDFFTTGGIATAPAITRKLLRDCGWAERTTAAEGNAVKRKYFGIITLGAIALPTNDDGDTTVNATIYCSQLNPATRFTFDGSDIDTSNRVSITAPMPDLFTGSRVVYQEPTSTPVGFGLTHNNFYYIRFESSTAETGARSGERHGTVGIGTTFRFRFFNSQSDALTGNNPITLTSGQSGICSIRHQTDAPNFFFDITEEGGAANEPFLYEFSAGAPDYQVYYNYDNYFKIYNREKARTYAEQTISQVGVTQINYQAYRIPLATSIDSNLQSAGVDISDTTLGETGTTYAGIGVSFHQTPVTRFVGGQPYQFNVTIDANQKTIAAVYQYVQGLLRTPSRTTEGTGAGLAYTSMNSLSAVGFGTDVVGARNEYGNDLRVGVTEEPLLEFIGNTLYAKLRNDIYGEIDPGETNHGVYIANVSSGQLTDVVYYDNDGQTRTEPFVSSYTLVFNTNLNSDGDARFWIFYNTDESIPGITTTFDITAAGVVDSSDGIDDTNDQFVSGNTVGFHPFVNGQEVVAIATVSNPGIGFTCDTLAAGIVTYTIDNEGAAAYELTGIGVTPAGYGNQTYTIGENNPTLYVYGGDSGVFNITAAGTNHPFYIKVGNPFIEGEYQTGEQGGIGTVGDVPSNQAYVDNNGGYGVGTNDTGIITMTVPLNYDSSIQYYYICSQHEAMRGEIKILDKRQDSQWKYYVNAQKSVGVAQTYSDIVESGEHPNVVGVGSTSTFKLHYTYLDAVANAGVGINTIPIQPSDNGNTGDVTFTQTDVNYQENNATIVQTSDKQFDFSDGQGNVGAAQTYARPEIYMDGIDVPSSGTYNFTFAYDDNHQRNRTHSTDASAKIVTIGLEGAQFLSQDFLIEEKKNITINIAAALERVYNDPTT